MNGALGEMIVGSERDVTRHHEGRPLITTLALVEGDILTYMEQFGASTLRELTRNLEWPSRLVTMAIGGLIRERMVLATEHDLEIVLERLTEPSARPPLLDEAVPEVWGG